MGAAGREIGAHHERVDVGLYGFALGQSIRVSLEGSADQTAARVYSAQLGVQLLL